MTPEDIIFAQHGWADTASKIAKLARSLATANSLVIAPDLGWLKTWLRIEPLIVRVEANASQIIDQYPHTPIKIIGHSMGGLIWLEILDHHPEWHSQIDSLVLLASPVGGANLARIIDPLGIGIGIARDLGKNRRNLAESIARSIPTLIVAGDLDGGSDGTISVGSTQFDYAQFICLPNLSHPALKNHPSLMTIITDFWCNPTIAKFSESNLSDRLIQKLRSIEGITDAHQRDFRSARVYLTFPDGTTIRTWRHPLQIDHVFVASDRGECLYAGFVGWLHREFLWQALNKIQQEYQIQKTP